MKVRLILLASRAQSCFQNGLVNRKRELEKYLERQGRLLCIIFFDEIDAIAPRRGGGLGGDSHVTERLISQLLTETRWP